MLEQFPLAGVLSLVAVVLVTIFFVTSSDSGSLVVDHLTSGGKLDSPVPQRVFWAVMEGVIAAVLLIGGGLATLQTAAVSTGLPFALVLLVGGGLLWIGGTVQPGVAKPLSCVESPGHLSASHLKLFSDSPKKIAETAYIQIVRSNIQW